MLTDIIPVMSDLVAIALIVSIYFHRHQRRDLLLAYIALNVGHPGRHGHAELGIGQCRPRPRPLRDPVDHQASVRLHHPGGDRLLLHRPGAAPSSPGCTQVRCSWWRACRGLLVGVMYVADHPRLFARARHLLLTIDAAIPNEDDLQRPLGRLGVHGPAPHRPGAGLRARRDHCRRPVPDPGRGRPAGRSARRERSWRAGPDHLSAPPGRVQRCARLGTPAVTQPSDVCGRPVR